MAVILTIALCFSLTLGGVSSTVEAIGLMDSFPALPSSAATNQNMTPAEPICESEQTSLLQTKAKVKPGNERASEKTLRTPLMKKNKDNWEWPSWPSWWCNAPVQDEKGPPHQGLPSSVGVAIPASSPLTGPQLIPARTHTAVQNRYLLVPYQRSLHPPLPARPQLAFHTPPQRSASPLRPLIQPHLQPVTQPQQQPPPQSPAGGSSGSPMIGIMQEIDKIADAAKKINEGWLVCREQVRGLWNAYTKKQLIVGSTLWIDGDNFENIPGQKKGDLYFAIVINDQPSPDDRTDHCAMYDGKAGKEECMSSCVMVQLSNEDTHEGDDDVQPFLISKRDIHEKTGDTLLEFLASVYSNACLNGLMESVKTILASTVQIGLKWLQSLLGQWYYNGFLAITIEGAVAWPSWLGVTSGKRSQAFSIVIWPREDRRTIASSSCVGKDTNDVSVDIGISLDIGFDNTCYQGAGLNIGAALQFPDGYELSVGLDIDCEVKDGSATCVDGLVPKFSGFSIGAGKGFGTKAGFATIGKGIKHNSPELFNLQHQIAWGVVACVSTEVKSCGGRDNCPVPTEAELWMKRFSANMGGHPSWDVANALLR